MKDRIIRILQTKINLTVAFIYDCNNKNYNGEPISYNIRRELNEVLESFYQLISTGILKTQEDTIIRRTYSIGEHVIFEKLLHFGNYYYSKQKLIHQDLHEKEEILRRTNVESASMLQRVRSYQLTLNGIGGSTDDYFIERMPQLLDGISYVVDKNLSEIFLPAFYNLLNLHQTIYNYFDSKHPTYHPTIDTLLKKVVLLTTKLSKKEEIINNIESNFPLALFFEQYSFYNLKLVGSNYKPGIVLETDLSHINFSQKLRILMNWSVLDQNLFLKHFETVFFEIEAKHYTNKVDTALIIRILATYLAITEKDQIEIIINIKVEKIEFSKHLPIYFNGIDKISAITISNAELALLHSYDDNTLRKKLGSCITNVPANEIEREVAKPHGVFEISDMELRIKINGELTYLCMPFKTGKEIKSDSVPVEIFYQILRPFFHFFNCVVVFISAKSCSQNLMNEIKRAQDRYDFAIEVIESSQLAKLLKYNSQLS